MSSTNLERRVSGDDIDKATGQIIGTLMIRKRQLTFDRDAGPNTIKKWAVALSGRVFEGKRRKGELESEAHRRVTLRRLPALSASLPWNSTFSSLRTSPVDSFSVMDPAKSGGLSWTALPSLNTP